MSETKHDFFYFHVIFCVAERKNQTHYICFLGYKNCLKTGHPALFSPIKCFMIYKTPLLHDFMINNKQFFNSFYCGLE